MPDYSTAFLKVRNHQRFQHYKKRSPPWIKWHRSCLDSYRFSTLPDSAKWHAVGLALLAASEGHFPANPEWLARRIAATEPVDIDLLVEVEFLVPCDCEKCNGAGRYQDASKVLDTDASLRRGEERRGKTEERRDRGESEEKRQRREETEKTPPDPPAGGEAVSAQGNGKTAKLREEFLEDFELWRDTLPDSSAARVKPTDDRFRKYKARLKDSSREEIQQALQGWVNDDWAQRPNHNQFEILIRNRSQVEKFSALHQEGRKRRAPGESRFMGMVDRYERQVEVFE